jgi:hypothetical protein
MSYQTASSRNIHPPLLFATYVYRIRTKNLFCRLSQQWRRWLGRGPMISHVIGFVDESIMATEGSFPGRWRVRVCNIDWRSRDESKLVVVFWSKKTHCVDRGGAHSHTVAQKAMHHRYKREFRSECDSSGPVKLAHCFVNSPIYQPPQPTGSTSDIQLCTGKELALWSMKCFYIIYINPDPAL